MIDKIISSLKGINYKLFGVLTIVGLSPTFYVMSRILIMGLFPNDSLFPIASQILWFYLLFEILDKVFLLPIFYLFAQNVIDKEDFTNRIKSGLLFIFVIYTLYGLLLILLMDPLLSIMNINPNNIYEVGHFLKLECFSNLTYALMQFSVLALLVLDKNYLIYLFAVAKGLLCIFLDILFVAPYSFSFNFGIKGFAYTDVISNVLIMIAAVIVILAHKMNLFKFKKLDFTWCKNFLKFGWFSGLDSLVANSFIVFFILRTINTIDKDGLFFVTISAVFAVLLMPIIKFGSLIKQEVSTDRNYLKDHFLGYNFITFGICALWVVLIPLYRPYLKYVLYINQYQEVYEIALLLLPWIILYAIRNIWISIMVRSGYAKQSCLTSTFTNLIYYTIWIILYYLGAYEICIKWITFIFGFSMGINALTSFIMFTYFNKKENYRLFEYKNYRW